MSAEPALGFESIHCRRVISSFAVPFAAAWKSSGIPTLFLEQHSPALPYRSLASSLHRMRSKLRWRELTN